MTPSERIINSSIKNRIPQKLKNLLPLCFLMFLGTSYSQDTIYMNNRYEEVRPAEASYYKTVEEVSGQDYDLVRNTYYLDHQLKARQTFRKKGDELQHEGKHEHWYKSGEFFYEIGYRKGKMHGDLLAYWPNGNKRRHDVFKRGKLKSGTVWNEEGEEVDYFEHMIPSKFPGGQEALQEYLRENLIIPPGQKKGTSVRVVLFFNLDDEGVISKIKVVEGAPQWYNSEAIRVLSEMPRWEPAMRFGEPVGSRYGLPLIFVK